MINHTLKLLLGSSLLVALSPAFAGGEDLDSRWTLYEANDVVSLRQDSLLTIKDENAEKDIYPELIFLCTPGDATVTARMDWHRFLGTYNIELGFKIDTGRFKWLKWKIDQNNTIATSPSSTDSQKLITLLEAGEKLLVEVTPYSASPVSVEYDLTGIVAEMAALRDRCGD